MLYPSLYLKQGRKEDALRLVQQHTFQSLLHLQTDLTALCSTKMTGNTALRDHAHTIYRALEQLFSMGNPMADLISVEIALEDGDVKKAADTLLYALNQLSGAPEKPYVDSMLFPIFAAQPSDNYYAMMRQMFLHDLETDIKYDVLRDTTQYAQAIQFLKAI